MANLDVTKMSATECYNRVRAFDGFPKSKVVIGGVGCVITEASVAEKAETTIDLKCRDGRFLIVKKLVPEGGKPMTAKDFINGYLRER